jgi:hypothetical protein
MALTRADVIRSLPGSQANRYAAAGGLPGMAKKPQVTVVRLPREAESQFSNLHRCVQQDSLEPEHLSWSAEQRALEARLDSLAGNRG